MADPVLANLELTPEEHDHFIVTRKDGAIGYVIMNAPEKLNMLGGGGMGGPSFPEAFRQHEADDDVKVIIFKGLGRAFSTGGNVATIGNNYQRDPGEKVRLSQRDYLRGDIALANNYDALVGCQKVVIAEGKGYVLGVALDYFLAADMYVCEEDCLFGYPPTRMIGHQSVFPLYTMLRLGPALHAEIFLMGRYVSAKEMYARGAINRSVPVEKLEDTVRAAAEAVACQPADGLYIGKLNKRIAWEMLGMRASGLVSSMAHAMSVQQKLGADEFNLMKARREHGAKEAFRIRDERLREPLMRYEEA